MTVYAGDFAELYDLFYREKPYDREAETVDRLLRDRARGSSARLLDVACGTGQHALAFARRGWSVVGVDSSPEMLSRARSNAGDTAASFTEQDMRRLDLPGDPFDAAVCLFDSIGYAKTNEGVLSTLVGIRRHLRPGGLLAMEFWHAPPMLRDHDPVRERAWELPGGRVERTSRTTLDVLTATARVEFEVRRYTSGNEEPWTWRETHENRFFLVPEMDLLLETAGLDPIEWLSAFDVDEPVGTSTWHVLAVARATAEPA